MKGRVVSSFSYPIDGADILKEFERIAHREDKDKSKLIWTLIEDYVKKHAEGNPTFELDKFMKDKDFKAFPTLGLEPADYLEGLSDSELKELEEQVEKWNRALKAKRINTEILKPPPSPTLKCPYDPEHFVPPYSNGMQVHLLSQHKELAIKDGRLSPDSR